MLLGGRETVCLCVFDENSSADSTAHSQTTGLLRHDTNMGLTSYVRLCHNLFGIPENLHFCCCLAPCCKWPCQEAWSGTAAETLEVLDKQHNIGNKLLQYMT